MSHEKDLFTKFIKSCKFSLWEIRDGEMRFVLERWDSIDKPKELTNAINKILLSKNQQDE